MAPVISSLSLAKENAIFNCLHDQYPWLQVDMLLASPAVKEGENFMSVVTRVDVVGHNTQNGEKLDLSLILKSLPESEERRLLFNCDLATANEVAFYSRVMPAMTSLTKLPLAPCLLAADDLVVLRHLGQDGYVMADRKKGLDLGHCQLVLKELGKFHAASLALKYNAPEKFFNTSSAVKEVFLTRENMILDACIDNAISMALKVVENMESPVVRKLKAIQGKAFQVLSPQVRPSEPLAVLCHGDLWSNNLLFRYSSDINQSPADVRFLDLQGCRYASPALDILYFLFSSSRPGVAKSHFKQLIDVYHRALVDQLRRLAPLAPSATLGDIMNEIKNHAEFGMVMSLVVLPVVTAEDIVINLDDVTEESLTSEELKDGVEDAMLTPGFKQRVNQLLEVFELEGLL